jgi:hypothetical protein
MLDQFLEHRGLGGELLRLRVGGHQLGQDEVDHVVLFFRLVEQLVVLPLLLRRRLERRIEDLFFELRVDFQLALDVRAQPLPLLRGPLRRLIQFAQQPLDRRMVRFEHRQYIGHRFLLRDELRKTCPKEVKIANHVA